MRGVVFPTHLQRKQTTRNNKDCKHCEISKYSEASRKSLWRKVFFCFFCSTFISYFVGRFTALLGVFVLFFCEETSVDWPAPPTPAPIQPMNPAQPNQAASHNNHNCLHNNTFSPVQFWRRLFHWPGWSFHAPWSTRSRFCLSRTGVSSQPCYSHWQDHSLEWHAGSGSLQSCHQSWSELLADAANSWVWQQSAAV